MLDPAVFLDMIQVDETTREGISVGCRKDTSPAKLQGLIILQLVLVLSVQHTVGECLTRSNTEQVAC